MICLSFSNISIFKLSSSLCVVFPSSCCSIFAAAAAASAAAAMASGARQPCLAVVTLAEVVGERVPVVEEGVV